MNAFLLHMADRLVLVDSGCGLIFGPELGLLASNLATVGVKPGDIDTILMTSTAATVWSKAPATSTPF